MSEAVIKYARDLAKAKYYGDVDFYCSLSLTHKTAISFLADHIETQDNEIATLKQQNQKLLDRLLNDNSKIQQPQQRIVEIPPAQQNVLIREGSDVMCRVP